EDNVAIGDGLVKVFGEAHFPAGTRAVAIAGDADEVEGGVELDVPRQVAEEDAGSLEHADKDDGLAGKIVGDLRPQLGNTLGDLLATEQDRKLGHERDISITVGSGGEEERLRNCAMPNCGICVRLPAAHRISGLRINGRNSYADAGIPAA